jgi:hypothetical protein
MAIRTENLGGTDWTNGEVLYAADLNDTFEATTQWTELYGPIDDTTFFCMHEDGKISQCDNGSKIQQTTDYESSNISWTSRNTTCVTVPKGVSCTADRSKAVAVDNSGNAAYTDDDGDTWSNATTDPPNHNNTKDISFPVAALAVVFGDPDGGGTDIGIWRSTDGGDVWAQATSMTNTGQQICCGDMYDASDGVCIAGAREINITANGGVAWTYNSDDLPWDVGVSATMLMVSSTHFVVAHDASPLSLVKYKASDGTYEIVLRTGLNSNYRPTNFVKTSNGYIYVAYHPDNNTFDKIFVYRSTDDGDTWSVREVQGIQGQLVASSDAKNGLATDGTTVLLCSYIDGEEGYIVVVA